MLKIVIEESYFSSCDRKACKNFFI